MKIKTDKINPHKLRRHDFANVMGHKIYFLFKKDKIVYIGRSETVYTRIHDHRHKNFDSFSFLSLDKYKISEVGIIERSLIKKYKPKYNKKAINWRRRQQIQKGAKKMKKSVDFYGGK